MRPEVQYQGQAQQGQGLEWQLGKAVAKNFGVANA